MIYLELFYSHVCYSAEPSQREKLDLQKHFCFSLLSYFLSTAMLLRPLRRQFAKFSRVYENALQTNAIKEDSCQKNVVRYLDRFQDILERYQRGKVPNVGVEYVCHI